jgi:hypothetical protein
VLPLFIIVVVVVVDLHNKDALTQTPAPDELGEHPYFVGEIVNLPD